jgi:uncharacterized protein (TIGR03083 family)
MTGERWNHDRYCDAAEAEIGRFADVLRDADPGAPVPTCPDWTVAELTRHLGGVHRWAAGNVRRQSDRRIGLRELGVKFPDSDAELPPWFVEGGAEVIAALRAADPDAPMWAWGADQHTRFWSRRMLYETAVHRADAEIAVGREPVIDAAVAEDGVDELLANLRHAAVFSPKIGELAGDGEIVAFTATDCDAHWRFELTAEGFSCGREGCDGGGAADAEVRAPIADLYLFMWGRRKLDDPRLTISGDDALLVRWAEHTAIM